MLDIVTIKTEEGLFRSKFKGGMLEGPSRGTPTKAMRSWLDHVTKWLKAYSFRSESCAMRRELIGAVHGDQPVTIEVLSDQLGLTVQATEELLLDEAL